MAYFDDLTFTGGDIIPGCSVVLNQRFPDTYSLEFLLAGRMAFGIDQQTQTILSHPAVFWHHPRHSYQYGAVDRRGWDHHYVQMRGPRAQRIVEQGCEPLSPCGYIRVRRPEAFAARFRALVGIMREHRLADHPRAVVILEELVAMLWEDARDAESPAPHRDGIEALAQRIRDEPGRRWDFSAEAEQLALSATHFRRLFSRYVGQPPHDFVLQNRCIRAAQALLATDMPIKRIARDIGACDPARFSRLFRERMGVSPKEYRGGLPRHPSSARL
jgi:AraC-like DNA-binding protein